MNPASKSITLPLTVTGLPRVIPLTGTSRWGPLLTACSPMPQTSPRCCARRFQQGLVHIQWWVFGLVVGSGTNTHSCAYSRATATHTHTTNTDTHTTRAHPQFTSSPGSGNANCPAPTLAPTQEPKKGKPVDAGSAKSRTKVYIHAAFRCIVKLCAASRTWGASSRATAPRVN